MKYFKAIIFVSAFFLIVFFNHGTGQKNHQQNKAISNLSGLQRLEIQRSIDAAFTLGDQRGIDLIINAVNKYKNSLSADDSSIGNLYHKTGVLYYINSSYSDAIYWFNKALPAREVNATNSLEPLINTLNGLAQSHLQLFHYDTAELLIERQLFLIDKNKHDFNETKADLYLADAQLAFVIEDYTRCNEKLLIASNLYESVNAATFNHGVVMNLLGVTTDLLDEPEKAIAYYQRAIQLFNLNQELQLMALSYHNLGMVYSKLNMQDSAIVYLNYSLNTHVANNDTIEISRNYIEIAKIEAAGNQLEKARQLAQASLAFREKMLPECHTDVIESQLVLGNILVQEGVRSMNQKKELDALAMALFDKAYLAALKSPRNERAIEPLANKALLFANQGNDDLEKALKAHDLFQQVDSMIQISRIHFRHQESKIEFTRKIRNTYEKAIANALRLHEVTNKKKYFEDALNFCEKSKATAIRDKLHKQSVQSYSNIPDSLLKQEYQLNLQLGSATQALLASTNNSDAAYNETLRTLESVKNKMEELDKRLQKNYPRYYNWLIEPEQKTSLNDIQEALRPGSLLVEYFLGNEQLFVIGVGKKHHQSWAVAINDSVVSAINNFRQNVENGKDNPVSTIFENAYQVYQLLLEQPLNYFSEKAEVTNLKIVPDGIIGSIPFDAMITNESKNITTEVPYLINKCSHSFLFSNRLLLAEAPRKQWFANKSSAIFGIDYADKKKLYGDSKYQSLPFIKEEVLSVQQLNGGDLYLNNKATLSQFEERLKDTEMLHIALHGYYNENNPNNSYLVFSKIDEHDKRNNALTLAAIYGLNARTQLIYLSACFSGKGAVAASEGVMSLSRAFTFAGAKSQVITLWEVSDRASAIIAKSFYQYLKKGETKDDALRLAKLNYMKESSTAIGLNPFFWAGTVVVGNAEPLYINPLITWLVAALILLFTFWFFRKLIIKKLRMV